METVDRLSDVGEGTVISSRRCMLSKASKDFEECDNHLEGIDR
jgi:hypothetical protein